MIANPALSIFLRTAIFGVAVVATASAAPQREVVVAMRYLQPSGNSHAHLYLYREDGKFLRQLTNDNSCQDSDPVFSPDGESIVFTRTAAAGRIEHWSVEPRGGKLRQLPAAPDWYVQVKTLPDFEHIFNGPPITQEPRPAPTDARAFTTPDGKTEVKIAPVPGSDAEIGAPDKWVVQLRDTRTGAEARVGELPGYSAGFLGSSEGDAQRYVLQADGICLAFCFLHLNSTDGNTVYALDLNGKRLVRLSPNWAEPFPLPGQAAFLTWTENRYVPYGNGEHTANCSYVERWDAALTAVRYAKGNAPGECYGASVYRPAGMPAVVALRPDQP